MDKQEDMQNFVREIHGTTWNATNEIYIFPAGVDEEERMRLKSKHEADRIVFNGLLPCPPEVVDALLAPVGELPKRVLDVGCGTGLWALEIASLYPHVEVQGIDLVPVILPNAPSNLRFSVVDVNNGLSAFQDQYDLVQVRSMAASTTNFPKSFLEFQQCLKPGGMLVMIDGRHTMWDAEERRVPMAKLEGDEDVATVSENGSMFERIFWEVHTTAILAGADASRSFPAIECGMWNEPLMDPDTACAANAYIPIGPWTQDPDPVKNNILQRIGTNLLQGFQNTLPMWHVPLRRARIPQETLNQWSNRAKEELRTMKHHMYCRYAYCWARRRALDGQPAPPLPEWKESMRVLSANQPPVRYPLTQEYTTAEAAKLAYEKRESSIGKWPTAYVQRIASTQVD